MFAITDQHIDFVLRDLDARGIKTPDLQQNLLDHLCILAERDLADGDDFYVYYRSVIPSFYREELAEIEAETRFLLRHRGPWLLLCRLHSFGLFVILVGPFIGFDLLEVVAWGMASAARVGRVVDLYAVPFSGLAGDRAYAGTVRSAAAERGEGPAGVAAIYLNPLAHISSGCPLVRLPICRGYSLYSPGPRYLFCW